MCVARPVGASSEARPGVGQVLSPRCSLGRRGSYVRVSESGEVLERDTAAQERRAEGAETDEHEHHAKSWLLAEMKGLSQVVPFFGPLKATLAEYVGSLLGVGRGAPVHGTITTTLATYWATLSGSLKLDGVEILAGNPTRSPARAAVVTERRAVW